MISVLHYLAALGLLLTSAFFSAAEMSYSSANQLRLENAMLSGSVRAKVAYSVYSRFEDALSAILIGNNLANFGLSALVSVMVIMTLGEDYTALASAVVTVLVIVFAEVVPKIVAKKNANRLALAFAYPVWLLTLLLRPLVFLTVALARLLTAPFKGEKTDDEDSGASELQSILETVEDEGVIDEERSELLQAALDFAQVSVSEVMTARVDMVAIDIEDDYEDILETIENAPYSRLPVYEESIDNIIGTLYLNHVFKALVDCGRVDVRAMLMEPCYVYKTLKLPAVLSELRRRQTHMAVVTDEYGGTLGLVTMEDVLEQIVGDIWDETDEVETAFLQREDGQYEVAGDLSMGEFFELTDLAEYEYETESATVGGWTTELFGAFPNVGDVHEEEDLTVTVLEMDGKRVERVLIQINKAQED